MKTTPTLTFQEMGHYMEEIPAPESDFKHRKSQHKAWGTIEMKTLKNKFFGIHEIKADLTDNFRIAFDEEHMLHSMNICVALDGNISLDLKGSNFLTTLSSLKHHSIYSHETNYDLIIDKSIHVIHVTVDREYYAGLLEENERDTAAMKEKLLNKDRVWSGTGNVSLPMRRAVGEILCNPLKGKLRELFTEAKILELVALQLNDFCQATDVRNTRSKDEDMFYDLRAYLDDHFREDLSLRMLSRMFGVNEHKLKKGFRNMFDTTVFDYIHDLKMLHARTLLLEDFYVSEVANTVGYKNPNHFSTAFKRKFGVSPTALK